MLGSVPTYVRISENISRSVELEKPPERRPASRGPGKVKQCRGNAGQAAAFACVYATGPTIFTRLLPENQGELTMEMKNKLLELIPQSESTRLLSISADTEIH